MGRQGGRGKAPPRPVSEAVTDGDCRTARTTGTDPTAGEWKEGKMATSQGRPERFLAYSTAGSQRDLARDAREQPHWDEHAAFIDGLVAQGFIQLGGPLDEEGGGFIGANLLVIVYVSNRCPIRSSPQPVAHRASGLPATHGRRLRAGAVSADC